MRKPKRSRNLPIIETLESLTKNYDQNTLLGAVHDLEVGIGWKILQAALIQEYQDHLLYALENCKKTGKQIEAAHQAGISETLLDIATALIPKYKDLLANKSAVTEDPRPEE